MISIRTLHNETEFLRLDSIYKDCFGDSSVPTERQKQWWKAAPNHILALFEHETLIGGTSIWALRKETANRFRSGIVLERNIKASDFETINPSCFYWSDLAIAPEFREKNYSQLLIQKLFLHVYELVHEETEIQILALIYSKSGQAVLQKLGFQKLKDATEMADTCDLWIAHFPTKNDLLSAVHL